MSTPGIRVLLVGSGFTNELVESIRTSGQPDYCETRFLFFSTSDTEVAAHIAAVQPHCVASIDSLEATPILGSQPLCVRRKWIDVRGQTGPEIARRIMACQMEAVVGPNRFPDQPLVSIFTPIFKTPCDVFRRTLASVMAQTYQNLEWVIYTDETGIQCADDESAQAIASALLGNPRIRSCSGRHSGLIGEVKRNAASLCRGKFLVELDHDDELMPHCVEDVVSAFKMFPGVGFAYSNCAELRNGIPEAHYGEGFGMGYGSYRKEYYGENEFDVSVTPPINAATLRYITGVPNHVRAWTSSAYWAAGGHNPSIPICDDYELILRTFLTTRMVHINRCGYIQHFHDSNSQDSRRPEIQRLCLYFSDAYKSRISGRISDLGGDDFMMKNGEIDWDAPRPADAKALNFEYSPVVRLESLAFLGRAPQRQSLAIITACSRPDNLAAISKSLTGLRAHWIVVLDYPHGLLSLYGHVPSVPRTVLINNSAAKLSAGGQHVKNIGLEHALKNDFTHAYFLDDDNLLHPDFVREFEDGFPDADLIIFDQEVVDRESGETLVRVPQPRPMQIDQGQYVVRLCAVGAHRIPHSYDGDGRFAETISAQHGGIDYIPKVLSFYNKMA